MGHEMSGSKTKRALVRLRPLVSIVTWARAILICNEFCPDCSVFRPTTSKAHGLGKSYRCLVIILDLAQQFVNVFWRVSLKNTTRAFGYLKG